MNHFKLALRLLLRDGRSGELTILVFALVIAVTSSTAISLFADRLQRTMTHQAAEFLAADQVITSPTPLPPIWHAKASAQNLDIAETVEFSSVIIENNEMLLAGIKAVSATYPLRGHMKVTTADYTTEQIVDSGPEPGETWVEKRVLSALKLNLGDTLNVGEKSLRITRLITYEPDKRGDLYSFSPRIMIHQDDLLATEVIQPGSHVHYFFQLSGHIKELIGYKKWARPLLNPSQRLMDIHEDRPDIGSALNRAERYLGLSSIVIVLISGVAIAMAARRYTERHINTTAILRTLGCKQNEILRLYISQFIMLGVTANLCACVLGWFAQQGLFHLLRNLLPDTVASPGPLALVFGFTTGMATLLGFALPPLLSLKQVSPLRVMRRETTPLTRSAWLVYGLAITIISVLLWRYTQDLKLTITIIGAGLLIILLFGLGIFFLLSLSRHCLPKLSPTWRFGLQGIIRHPQASVSQILAFSTTLVAMLVSYTVSTDLLADWKEQLPDNAPNHFALNIFPTQLESFKNDLNSLKISDSLLYPVVRGRLTQINGTPVQQIVSKESQGERATHRDLSLTWSRTLPEANNITSGNWWEPNKKNQLSIEQKLAKSLKVKVGDHLNFTVGSEQFSAVVANIRALNWDTMKPNFYMIFSPGTLEGYATTYITSFYLSETKKNDLNYLVKKYPGLTVLEVDIILKQIKTILAQLTQTIHFVLIFALFAGFTVLLAAVYATLDRRIYDGALLRSLGASRHLLRLSQIIEFSSLGFISGILAVIISEIITWILYTIILNMDYVPNYLYWSIVPVSAAIFIGLVGYWGVRNVPNKSPMLVLRDLT